MKEIEELKSEVERIKGRNKKVEADKAWETSFVRRACVAASTYCLVVILFFTIGVDKPFLNAIIPAVAYIISTASLGVFKSWWLKNKERS